MRELFEFCRDQYFTTVFLHIVLIIAVFISLKNKTKFEILKYFPVYIASLLLVSTTQYLFPILKSLNYKTRTLSGIAEYLDYLFTLIELITFSHLYYHLIKNQFMKKLVLTFDVFFLLFFVYMAIQDKKFYQDISGETQSIVYTVEAVILLFFCSFYFVELFQKLPYVNIKNEPTFWVSTGLLFFMTCTLPYSMLENYIFKIYPEYFDKSYSIFPTFYTLLFLMIMRAYLCKPEKTI